MLQQSDDPDCSSNRAILSECDPGESKGKVVRGGPESSQYTGNEMLRISFTYFSMPFFYASWAIPTPAQAQHMSSFYF